jgi:hypothetical protein
MDFPESIIMVPDKKINCWKLPGPLMNSDSGFNRLYSSIHIPKKRTVIKNIFS